jgi:hypothetical protein
MAAVADRIVSGEPLTERKSTFQAHVARVTDPKEVAAVIAVLLQSNKCAGGGGAGFGLECCMIARPAHPIPQNDQPTKPHPKTPAARIASASHPAMTAYRIATERPGVYLQDCDDDGETAAGGRLLHLLQLARAENVVVVVSRWFGGVLLGPSRFGVISNCARDLLVREGFIAGAGGGGGGEGAKGGKKKGRR